MGEKSICIIPARGGSKRIPRKNIRPFLGKPIIAYSIEAALNSACFETVLVSTDDEEIAEVAANYGAAVPFLRSSKNADDHATVFDVVSECMAYFDQQGQSFDSIACLFATAPFVTSQRIQEANAVLESAPEADSVFFIQSFNYPIKRSLFVNKKGHLEMEWPENLNTRSQDFMAYYHDAGQFYIAKKTSLFRHKTFFCPRSHGIKLSQQEAVDIDTPEDWAMAELIYNLRKS